MESKDRDTALAFKKLLIERLGGAEVIVFGSRARGDNDSDSDMDLCVIVDQLDRETRDKIFDSAWEVGFSEGIVIVPVIFTRDEIKGVLGNSPVYKSVEREGVRV